MNTAALISAAQRWSGGKQPSPGWGGAKRRKPAWASTKRRRPGVSNDGGTPAKQPVRGAGMSPAPPVATRIQSGVVPPRLRRRDHSA